MIYQRKLVLWRSFQRLLESFSEGLLNYNGKSWSFEENKLLLFAIIISLQRTMNYVKDTDSMTIN